MNHLGHARHRLLIVLNDNEMSISPSVGGLSTRLNKLRLTRAYQETKSVTIRALPRLPLIGRPLYDLLAWAKEGFKRSWASVGFFEDMGITYIGVLDGHDHGRPGGDVRARLRPARTGAGPRQDDQGTRLRAGRAGQHLLPRRQPAARST